MATHIQRFVALVEAILGQRPTNSQLKSIADDFVSYRRDQIEAAGFDIKRLTRAQKASVVLDAYSHHNDSVAQAMFTRRETLRIKNAADKLTSKSELEKV